MPLIIRTMLTSGLVGLASLVILQSQMIRPSSAEVTFLNTWGTLGNGDGQFSSPFGVAVAGTGQVYVAARPLDRRGVCGPWRDAPQEATTILRDGVFPLTSHRLHL